MAESKPAKGQCPTQQSNASRNQASHVPECVCKAIEREVS